MMPERIDRLLVVEDDAALVAVLEKALRAEVGELRSCAGATSALALLRHWTPDLVLLDFSLRDGDAFDVLAALHARQPTPRVIAISGTASPDISFRLAQRGVHSFLAKPFEIGELRRAMKRALQQPLDITPQLKSNVGQRGIHEVELEVRETMLNEALARAKGSRRGAARLLDISRQLIQHMLRRKRRPRDPT